MVCDLFNGVAIVLCVGSAAVRVGVEGRGLSSAVHARPHLPHRTCGSRGYRREVLSFYCVVCVSWSWGMAL